MRNYVAYLLFALTAGVLWSWFQNQFTFQNLVVGFLWGVAILLVWGHTFLLEPWTHVTWRKGFWGAVYMGILLKEIFLANIFVARRLLRLRVNIRPGIVKVPTDLDSGLAVTTLANSITLTPGTFTLYITPDNKTLFVHALDMESPEQVAAGIKGALERPIRRVEQA